MATALFSCCLEAASVLKKYIMAPIDDPLSGGPVDTFSVRLINYCFA